MKYNYKYKTTAFDIWQLSMYGIYGSMLGIVNGIFTVAMILLAIRFFADVHITLKVLLIIAICLFSVIQPIILYLRAKKQMENMPEEVNLSFDDQGMHVKINSKKTDLKWQSIRGISKKPTMLVVFSSAQHGFVLNNKVLQSQRDDLYDYVMTRIEANKIK